MVTAALVVFAACLLVTAYVYFGYPALLLAVSRMRPRPVRAGPVRPPVTVVVPAHNEAATIAEKVRNTLASDYPEGALEVLVASDGSTDGTVDLARSVGDPRVRVLELPRRGKAFALNAAAAAARGEVLVFSDANCLLERGSLAALVEPLADPEVGGVCGRKRQRAPAGADATARGESLYWRYDTWLKSLESRIGSVFAADGVLYAVRRAAFVPVADPALADDIAISARVPIAGLRLVHEPRAVAWEEAPAEGLAELRRKVRVTNHSVRALLDLGPALLTRGFYSLELLSHKLLRHLVPFFLLAMLASHLVLAAASAAFAALLVPHVAFYALAAAGAALRARAAGRRRLLSVPYYFCLVNAAALLGVLSIVRGRRLRAWSPRSGLDQEVSREQSAAPAPPAALARPRPAGGGAEPR